MITMMQFVRRSGIKMTAKRIHGDRPGFLAGAKTYSITLRKDGKRMRVMYSMGPGCKGRPTLTGVLHCLRMDASSYIDSRDYADFIANVGGNYSVYGACKRVYGSLGRVFETAGRDALLYDCDWS